MTPLASVNPVKAPASGMADDSYDSVSTSTGSGTAPAVPMAPAFFILSGCGNEKMVRNRVPRLLDNPFVWSGEKAIVFGTRALVRRASGEAQRTTVALGQGLVTSLGTGSSCGCRS